MKVSNFDTIHLINKFYYSKSHWSFFFNKLSATKGKLKNSCFLYESLVSEWLHIYNQNSICNIFYHMLVSPFIVLVTQVVMVICLAGIVG